MRATEAAQRTTVAGIPVITGGSEKNHEDRQADCANRGGLRERVEIKMEMSEMRKVRNETVCSLQSDVHMKPSVRLLTW